MNDKEIKQHSERYVELLVAYDHYVEAMEKVVQKITETRKELVFLEEELKKAGVKIKDVE